MEFSGRGSDSLSEVPLGPKDWDFVNRDPDESGRNDCGSSIRLRFLQFLLTGFLGRFRWRGQFRRRGDD